MATSSRDRLAAFFTRKKADNYKYLPLDEEAFQIRLLTLRPGKFPAKIHVDIRIEQLTGERGPKYEALSYAWGSTENLVDIYVGRSTRYSLAVTRNLASALRHLRYGDRDRVLWIDAICVNQKDLQERSQQVKRMASIYTMTYRVLVWLGEEENNSSTALHTLEMLSTKIEVSLTFGTIKPTSTQASEAHWANHNEILPFNTIEWSAIDDLLSRSWFERLWIWQEIRFANQQAIVMCGHDSVLWESFCTAIYCLYVKEHPGFLDGFARRKRRAYNLASSQTYDDFYELSERTKHSKCTDAKDRVYALLSMLRVEKNPRIEPDYTKSVQEVYQDLFKKHVESSNNLWLLQRCEILSSSNGLPTWVPDWSIPRQAQALRLIDTNDSSANVSYLGEEILKVKGVRVATIQYVDDVRFDDSCNMEDASKELQRLAFRFNIKDDRVEPFCRTIFTNNFSDSFVPPITSYPNFQQSVTATNELLIAEPYISATVCESLKLFSNVFDEMASRSFFRTHQGQFGLAPSGAKKNDVICVLLGCSSAMALRPTKKGQYQVVGEAYYHGFMNNEAFLGPLPKHYAVIAEYQETNGAYSRRFLNRESGITQRDDPRQGPLPTGWRVKGPAENGFDQNQVWFVNDGNGVEATRQDPWLTPEALRERRVDLRDFELV